jgi:hypothetical protein
MAKSEKTVRRGRKLEACEWGDVTKVEMSKSRKVETKDEQARGFVHCRLKKRKKPKFEVPKRQDVEFEQTTKDPHGPQVARKNPSAPIAS